MNKRALLSYGLKMLAAVALAVGMTACEDDSPEPAPDPARIFKVHIGEGNVVEMDTPDLYPSMYMAVLVMEDLPADEKIIYMGGVYSTENPEPDIDDCTLIYDYSEFDVMQDWDWEKEPLYYRCMYLFHPVPGKTYYVRGYVQTDKGEYYSNTIEVKSNFSAPAAENPDAYDIPVIFHLFPDADGNYPVKDWMIEEQIDYANLVYGNYFNIPGQTETGVRFTAATHTPDGTPLATPGIVYEKEAVEINYERPELDDKYVWDNEYALNVWVCPIKNTGDFDTEYSRLGGFAFFPYFDADEALEGCTETYKPGLETGIFLNSEALIQANAAATFAHEAGHFLGLEHVFAPGDDFCADTPWYDYAAHWASGETAELNYVRMSGTGQKFISDNIMDYEYGFMTGITPNQRDRIQYTLQHAYLIPGPAGKEMPGVRSSLKARRFGKKPVR